MAKKGAHFSVFEPKIKEIPKEAQTSSRPYRTSRFSKFLSRFSAKVLRGSSIVRKSLAAYVCDEMDAKDRSFFYQRVMIIAKNIAPTNLRISVENVLSEKPKQTFMEIFLPKLYDVLTECQDQSFCHHETAGLFLCMGDYTLLILEGTEDMCGGFCIELSKIAEEFFSANRVFLVDDNISDLYFNGFSVCRSAAININEKFPPSTTSDFELLSEQHCAIREKIRGLCTELKHFQKKRGPHIEEDLLFYPPETIPDFVLPPDQFNKFLPEVQRMDIVLSCTKFYRNLQQFSIIYKQVAMQEDETALVWPSSYRYLPVGTFKRSPFDVNLTFSDYGKIEEETHEEGDNENTQDT